LRMNSRKDTEAEKTKEERGRCRKKRQVLWKLVGFNATGKRPKIQLESRFGDGKGRRRSKFWVRERKGFRRSSRRSSECGARKTKTNKESVPERRQKEGDNYGEGGADCDF